MTSRWCDVITIKSDIWVFFVSKIFSPYWLKALNKVIKV